MALLHAEGLSKRYRGVNVVDGVSVGIRSGETVGLLGPNGAGKTTCFYMIVGLIPIDEGTISLDDEDITALPMHARARRGIGYLPQEASVFRKLTVEQNILAVLELRRDLDHGERRRRVEDLLEEFHITQVRKHLGLSLSGGERRRVEIARALALEPAFILLDEPFAGVDPISVADIKHMLRQLSGKGIGLLITDHNVRETLDICDRAYILNEGHIIAEGNPKAILADTRVRRVYLGEDFSL
ncbi:MAG: LPS export ABC transporter ATP-binding protein [Gammaproteobacteria bacterium]|jgi:lipopolysaccharide export system ATP-binding protein